jgi:mannosyltransferase OCH1-like enzyme
MVESILNSKYKFIIFFIIVFILIFLSVYHLNLIQYNTEAFRVNNKLHEIPFFIENTDIYSPRTVSNVPLVIYESWHSNRVPVKMKDTIYKLIKMNPEFDYYLYSDKTSLKPGAYKSDLWRYCILYKKGGVYLDIKYYSLVPLINIIRENSLIFVKDILSSCPTHRGIYNAFMVSPPNNNIFKICIDDIVNSCKFKLYKVNCLDITGPCLLGKITKEELTKNYVNKIKFSIKTSTDGHIVLYNGDEILKIYKEYREEQKQFQKTKHYGEMWKNRDVYNEI